MSFSGSYCFAAAAARATCNPPCSHGGPSHEFSISCSSDWPPGQKAGGAGSYGTDAGDVQLHAGQDLLICKKLFFCSFWCDTKYLSYLRTQCWSLTVSPLTLPLSRHSPWILLRTWTWHRWCALLVSYNGLCKYYSCSSTVLRYRWLMCVTQILVHPESRLSQPNVVPVQPEPSQVSLGNTL